ncbi:MAG: glycosyl hydrolase family 65 protein [Gemmatimonadota bacterium]
MMPWWKASWRGPAALALAGALAWTAGREPERPAPADRPFAVTDTSVVQGPFEAVAPSRERIVSTYPRAAREIIFKFSINGTENEFPPGSDHLIYLRPRRGELVTPVYTFGRLRPASTPEPTPELTSEEGPARVTFRLDMRHVLEAFEAEGSYDPPNGPPIDAEEFEGVYVMGNTEPLSWDMSELRPGSPAELHDPDGDGIYEGVLTFDATYNRPRDDQGRAVWTLREDLSGFPAYRSSQRLVDALHRLSLEEVRQLVRDDGALRAGERWPDVWTRDVSWAAILAFTPIVPDAVRRSLAAKVDEAGRIIQDTGTGGSWPVSTDRVAWAVAAWELYAVTGDRDWLRTAYDVIRRSADADLRTVRDRRTGLFRGESSFLDWREQSYPRWMDPKDIYASQALGTNALHHATYRVLSRMAAELDEPADSSGRYDDVARAVRRGLDAHLWQDESGYYGQYLYGRSHPVASPRAEALGESFAILFGLAGAHRAERLARSMPVVPYGVPSFWPSIPDVPPYHNSAIWPQVVAFWTWAAADAGNGAAVEHGLASIWRAAALFLTNKENMVASTGHFEGTELNSDYFMGSVAGNLATVYRVLLGMRFHADRLVFEPFVPEAWAGERTLEGLRYRDAELTVTVRRFGAGVERVVLDGRPVRRAEIPADLSGRHELEITLDDVVPESRIHLVEDRASPRTPRARLDGNRLAWVPVEGAARYRVYRNGRSVETTSDTFAAASRADGLLEYQVAAIAEDGVTSFLSEPVRVAPDDAVLIVEPAEAALETDIEGHAGRGYVPLTPERNPIVELPFEVAEAGLYAVDVRYANGSGPVNSSDRAAVRTLLLDGERVGALVMPQRGADLWADWGYSSALRVRLAAGIHTLTIAYTASDRNMNIEVNDALLDHVRLTRLPEVRP